MRAAPGDVLVAATDGLWEARREGVQFGDARLGALLAEHGPHAPAPGARRRLREEAAALGPLSTTTSSCSLMPGPPMSPALRAEPPDGRGLPRAVAEYMALVGERLDEPDADPDHIFATPESFTAGRRLGSCLDDGERPAGCGGLRAVDARDRRDQADVRRRGRARPRPRAGAARRARAPRAAAGQRRSACSPPRCSHEARAALRGGRLRVVAPRASARARTT